jgi:hypothetical protein
VSVAGEMHENNRSTFLFKIQGWTCRGCVIVLGISAFPRVGFLISQGKYGASSAYNPGFFATRVFRNFSENGAGRAD